MPRGVYQHIGKPRKHGATGSPAYKSWEQMIQRCLNPLNPSFPRYGGRGITVCARWLEPTNFLKDMGPRPLGTSIERNNNSGSYEPSNCRWATPTEQANNRRSSSLVFAFGEWKTLAQWGRDARCQVSQFTLLARIRRGWDSQKAVDEPLK